MPAGVTAAWLRRAQRGLKYGVAGELEEAVEIYDRALKREPKDWRINLERVAPLVELGRLDETRTDLEIARKNWPKSWGSQFTAPVIAWFWGRGLSRGHVDRLRKAYLAAGAPEVPENPETEAFFPFSVPTGALDPGYNM